MPHLDLSKHINQDNFNVCKALAPILCTPLMLQYFNNFSSFPTTQEIILGLNYYLTKVKTEDISWVSVNISRIKERLDIFSKHAVIWGSFKSDVLAATEIVTSRSFKKSEEEIRYKTEVKKIKNQLLPDVLKIIDYLETEKDYVSFYKCFSESIFREIFKYHKDKVPDLRDMGFVLRLYSRSVFKFNGEFVATKASFGRLIKEHNIVLNKTDRGGFVLTFYKVVGVHKEKYYKELEKLTYALQEKHKQKREVCIKKFKHPTTGKEVTIKEYQDETGLKYDTARNRLITKTTQKIITLATGLVRKISIADARTIEGYPNLQKKEETINSYFRFHLNDAGIEHFTEYWNNSTKGTSAEVVITVVNDYKLKGYLLYVDFKALIEITNTTRPDKFFTVTRREPKCLPV